MTNLSDKIKIALDESRILVLGTQILLGFQYRAFFEEGFTALPRLSQNLKLIALVLLLLAIALIMWPSAYHRVVARGADSEAVHWFATRVMDFALLPVAGALALDFYVMGAKVLGVSAGLAFAIAIGLAALLLWFGYALLERWHLCKEKSRRTKKPENQRMEKTPLHKRVDQVLTETRVVLPGAQALMGFQFATMLLGAFDKLPASSKYIHLASLGLMTLTVIILMTPAAHHRLVERGEDTEHFHAIATLMLLAAMVTLPLGMCGDLFVVVLKVTGSMSFAIAASGTVLAIFYGLWFGFTTYWRGRLS
ncbi:MAG TPA: DUF6328 family protein [Pyrinomonadaceae bacterium]|nr:DUF6328 family protein [Pyrinomonadaceae bacterium]